VQYPQETASQCQDVWIQHQAIQLKFMQNGPYPEQMPTELPTWLSEEVARQEASPVDISEVQRALEQCQVCNADGPAGTGVVVPAGGASPPISVASSLPVPSTIPRPAIVPAAAPEPAPEPVFAPPPVPEVAVDSPPPPDPTVVPASAGIVTASSSFFKSACVVTVSTVAMLFF
jgi:hypothetical protein